MNRFVATIVVIIVVTAALTTGVIFYKTPKQGTSPLPPCLDFDPPSPDKVVTYQGAKYHLIKENARVSGPTPPRGEEDKFNNGMELKGTTEPPDNRPVYQLKTTNYFGATLPDSIIFVLRDQHDGASFFDLFIKEGEAIPDFVRSCKRVGGQIPVLVGAGDEFPPPGFNSSQVTGGGGLPAPAYVRSQAPKTNFGFVKGLTNPPAQPVGRLFVKSRNKDFSLYYHLGTAFLIDDNNDAYPYLPTNDSLDFSTTSKKSLQIREVRFVQAPTYSWETPECKPAIYLYPEIKTRVNVRVSPKGYFTLTIPKYPEEGWDVMAYPDGKIESDGAIYPYLYYESKIKDSEIEKPRMGFVAEFSDLPKLYDEVLPKLGLMEKEATDFKNYWGKVLPYAPYYFVGVMSDESIEQIEPIKITPKPQTTIRVRLYFESLNKPIQVEEPYISKPERSGFTVIEWGGLVKTDPDHPFTCSQ